MIWKKTTSLLLIFFWLAQFSYGWAQNLDDQARFYLQRIGPSQRAAEQLLPEKTQLPGVVRRPYRRKAEALEGPPAQILTTAPRQPEEISAIEKRALNQLMLLKQFGYSFFYQPPATFLPVESVPVGPDYIIGPGDTIRIVLWGSVEGEYRLTVDRNGQVDIPKVGVIHVSGLNYRQLQEVLDREFSLQFTNFQMNVTLDNLRTIRIYVVGQARFPGSYSVSSLSTLVSALFAAGGPSKSGSMRDIQVRRGGKVIVHFDMYDFLIRGDKSKDIRLQSEDVIFIPPIGPLAAIGTPKTPEEIETELRSLARLELEGEPTRMPLQTLTEIDATKDKLTRTQMPPEKLSVMNWRQFEALKIISRKTPEEYQDTRKTPEVDLQELNPAEVEAYFEKRYGLSLKDAVEKLARNNRLAVGGPIKVPGIYELKKERTLTDLLDLAGGLGDTAFKGRVQVLRVKGHQEMVLFDKDLDEVLTGRVPDFPLVDGDLVKIFCVPEVVEQKVRIAGAIKAPGEFGLRDHMRVKDLINYAGGLLMHSNKNEAHITRTTITPQGTETTRLYFSPRRALRGEARDNILLQPNDYVFIRPVADWDLFNMVRVEGAVKFPGNYSIKKGETLSSILTLAGGFTDKAYPLGGVLTRRSAKEIQKQQLKAAIDRLEAEMLALAAEKAATGIGTEEAKRAEVYAAQQQKLLARLRTIEPLGRVIIRLDDPERLRGTPEDIELKEGDILYIPETMQTVNVVGAVFNPTAVIYSPYRTVQDYITMAGGTTRNAETKEIYVIKVNGAAVSRHGFGWFGSSWNGTEQVFHVGGLKSLTLDPGDTIVVPEKLERIAWLKEVKDVATILGQIAVVAGVVLVGLK